MLLSVTRTIKMPRMEPPDELFVSFARLGLEAMNGVKHRLVAKLQPYGLVFVRELPHGTSSALHPKMDHLVKYSTPCSYFLIHFFGVESGTCLSLFLV